MTSTAPVWLTPQAHEQLRAELAELTASDTYGEVSDEELAVRYQRRARIRQIQELLAEAVIGQDPPDDGIAEPGMVLTVRYDETDDIETFLLGVRDLEHGDLEVYSPESPLGAALTGASRGEQRTYRVPNGATVRVTLLDAVPYSRVAEATAGQPPTPAP
ncbi:GreA/GreB family elongation factor [Nocardia sp. X0981]